VNASCSAAPLPEPVLGAELPLLERVRAHPPHWAEERIAAWDERGFKRLEPFAIGEYWADGGSLNVFRVVGTQHADYQGKTWMEFLEGGKRMEDNLASHATNPGYYLQTEHKRPSMNFISTDGMDWYVSWDGNHRTCIARFDFHYRGITTLHGLTLKQYRFDEALFRLTQEIRSLLARRAPSKQVEVEREPLGREDTPGWKLDRYRVSLRVVDGATGEETVLTDAEAARAYLLGLQAPLHAPRRSWLPWGRRAGT
jgi:hypothetical protein